MAGAGGQQVLCRRGCGCRRQALGSLARFPCEYQRRVSSVTYTRACAKLPRLGGIPCELKHPFTLPAAPSSRSLDQSLASGIFSMFLQIS